MLGCVISVCTKLQRGRKVKKLGQSNSGSGFMLYWLKILVVPKYTLLTSTNLLSRVLEFLNGMCPFWGLFIVYSSSISVLFNLWSLFRSQMYSLSFVFVYVRYWNSIKYNKLNGSYLLARDRFIFDLTKVSLTELSE